VSTSTEVRWEWEDGVLTFRESFELLKIAERTAYWMLAHDCYPVKTIRVGQRIRALGWSQARFMRGETNAA
jgi:hypothetical protein